MASDILSTRIEDEAGGVPSLPNLFRALLWGPDTIYFSFETQVSEETYVQLLGEKGSAQVARKQRRASYCSPWLDAEVLPNGTSGFAIIINKANEWTVKVQRENPCCPGVYIEMRSKLLHCHPGGPIEACRDAAAWVRDLLFADSPDEVRATIALRQEKLSRFDMHLDWQGGWHPELVDATERQFIRPSRVKWDTKMEGDVCTGFVFGKHRIMARIYNKTLEATTRHDEEYLTLVKQQAGDAFDEAEDLWRLEFELKREGVEGFCLATNQDAYADDNDELVAEMEGEDLPTINTIEKAMHWSSAIFTYLTTRWLRLTMPTGDRNKARWPVHPVWQEIQQAYTTPHSPPLSEEKCQLVREARHSGKRRLITKMATEITTTAYLMLESDPTQAVQQFLEHMEYKAERMAEYQHLKRVKSKKKLDNRREEQYQRNIAHLAAMAGGYFALAGVYKQDLSGIEGMGDLLAFIQNDMEEIAKYKGGVSQMLYDKWCREYQVMPPMRLFRLPRVV